MKLTEEHKKVLTEYLGECWHDPQIFTCADGSQFIRCTKCKYPARSYTTLRTFTTPADLHAIYSKMVDNGDWLKFLSLLSVKFGKDKEILKGDYCVVDFAAWLFCLNCEADIPARMKMAAEWIGMKG